MKKWRLGTKRKRFTRAWILEMLRGPMLPNVTLWQLLHRDRVWKLRFHPGNRRALGVTHWVGWAWLHQTVDGGYFSHPNSPQNSLKLERISRRSYQSQVSNISNGRSSTSATEDNKISLEKQNLNRSGNVFRDTTKVQSKTCQRSHSFSGGSNLPLSIYQQRPRSNSTSCPVKPEKKRYSFSGALPLSRRESSAKLTLSFLTVMNDVPDTFIWSGKNENYMYSKMKQLTNLRNELKLLKKSFITYVTKFVETKIHFGNVHNFRYQYFVRSKEKAMIDWNLPT